MKNKSFIISICALLLNFSFIGAEDCCDKYAYLAPYYPQQPCGEFTFEADYLYLRPRVENLEFASTVIGPGTTTAPTFTATRKQHDFHFHWDSGSRINLGYNLPCDAWAVNLLWTEFYSKTHGSTFVPLIQKSLGTVFFNILLPDSSIADVLGSLSARANWHLNFNQVDLLLSRRCWLGPKVQISPYFGGTFLSIHQKMNTFANFVSTDGTINLLSKSHLKNNFSAGGIRGGLQTVWNLIDCLSLFGDVGASLVYGRFCTDASGLLSMLGQQVNTSLPNNFNSLRSTFDCIAGLEWRFPCPCFGNEIYLRGAGELHLYFDQNQFPIYESSAATGEVITRKGGDLALYGFSIAAGIVF